MSKPKTHARVRSSELVVPLDELKRRMDEAKQLSENAYWMNRPWVVVEMRMDAYADAKREYESALERHNNRICDK